jgi:hypothetical protein
MKPGNRSASRNWRLVFDIAGLKQLFASQKSQKSAGNKGSNPIFTSKITHTERRRAKIMSNDNKQTEGAEEISVLRKPLSVVPPGLDAIGRHQPSVKTPGYFRLSLRDMRMAAAPTSYDFFSFQSVPSLRT